MNNSLTVDILGFLKRRKAKQKAKRDSELLALYRDWPPDLVDTFLQWENGSPRKYGYSAPAGYVHWKDGVSYADHLSNPKEGVIVTWR